jgi:short-subunit dehydrogenase
MTSTKKHVLITGGTTGIGYELARLFAKDHYNLVLVARKQQELDKAAKDLKLINKIEIVTIAKDLFNKENAFAVYDEIKSKGIKIGILINNAGHGLYGKFEDTDLRKELDIIELNVASLVILTKLYLKEMIRNREGRILNLSSIASKSPGPWQSVYHGTKAFVQSFTEAIREEVKDKGVSVTALLPGATATDFFHKAGMQSSKIMKEDMADPADVAKDGYEALMSGKDMVVSGFSNKMQVVMSGMQSDEKLAAKMAKKQEPVESYKH